VPHAACAYIARAVLGRAAPRFVTTLHGTDVTGIGAEAPYRPITRFTVAASDGITVPSVFLRAEAERLLDPCPHAPIEVIPNFVDTDRFAPPARRERARLGALFPDAAASDAPVLFHVSNFRALKRIGDLIEVVARLGEIRLVLVGDGPERSPAVEEARRLGVASRISFLGRQTDFAELLAHADAFLLPSESESFGVAALEALSAGVPVFGYRVGGLPEVVSGDVGRLVVPFDVAALAAAVGEVVIDAKRRVALGAAARARALAFFRRAPGLDRYEAYLGRIAAGEAEPPR
jgi:L-malate glycosyltransferase